VRKIMATLVAFSIMVSGAVLWSQEDASAHGGAWQGPSPSQGGPGQETPSQPGGTSTRAGSGSGSRQESSGTSTNTAGVKASGSYSGPRDGTFSGTFNGTASNAGGVGGPDSGGFPTTGQVNGTCSGCSINGSFNGTLNGTSVGNQFSGTINGTFNGRGSVAPLPARSTEGPPPASNRTRLLQQSAGPSAAHSAETRQVTALVPTAVEKPED